MALTINQKGEIKKEELLILKEVFRTKSNSGAVTACVKFLVEYIPYLESRLNQVTKDVIELNKKCITVLGTIDEHQNYIKGALSKKKKSSN